MSDEGAASGVRVGWLDCSSGASGDMLLGALVGAGVPLEVIATAVAALAVPVTVDVRPTIDESLAAHQAVVTAQEEGSPRRTLADVGSILDAAALDPVVRGLALGIFDRLARAEARVHGTTVEEVHFHEVGALDALADVVGCAAGFVHLGLTSIVVSPIALGSGRARTEHGEIPVPVPAVLELIREAGLLAVGGSAAFEQCTPTGAAVLAALATGNGLMPQMTVTSVGVGAGTRRTPGTPNVVRLVVGTTADSVAGTSILLSTNIDDLDPRLWPSVLEQLMEAGASDAWLTPILMKKGRPAHTLSVLCPSDPADLAGRMRVIIFRETTAIGLREQVVAKHALDRADHVIEVDGGSVRVKVAMLAGQVLNVQPEYEDVLAAARTSHRPVKVVLAEAQAAAQALKLAP